MKQLMNILSRLGDKAGVVGTLVSAMGCAGCFPAIASLGAALGLGFLEQWEGVFVNTLLPLFAATAMAANFLGWFGHHQYKRTILGMIGPAMVLATLFPLWDFEWSTNLLYAGIAMMTATALWDIFSPSTLRCADGACKTPQQSHQG
jgi:mercuric ion transport protein